MKKTASCLVLLLLLFAGVVHAKEIVTNEAVFVNPPDWLLRTRAQHVIDHIQLHLEWSTRQIKVYWHYTTADYARAQNFGPLSVAVTKIVNGKAEIHMGPEVTTNNFDEVFGHELVHVIAYQKWKGAIPKWLEEGLANFYSSKEKINYRWLASQPFPKDVRLLAHPFHGTSKRIIYRYRASQALAEMLAHKCGDMDELLRLTVAADMETYIRNTCEINDLNKAFRDWVKTKGTPGA